MKVVPRRPGELGRPADWFDQFPDGTPSGDAPPGVRELAHVAARLRDVLESISVSEFARRARVDRRTMYDLLAGDVWIDTSTLARLERAAGVRLWPERFELS